MVPAARYLNKGAVHCTRSIPIHKLPYEILAPVNSSLDLSKHRLAAYYMIHTKMYPNSLIDFCAEYGLEMGAQVPPAYL